MNSFKNGEHFVIDGSLERGTDNDTRSDVWINVKIPEDPRPFRTVGYGVFGGYDTHSNSNTVSCRMRQTESFREHPFVVRYGSHSLRDLSEFRGVRGHVRG